MRRAAAQLARGQFAPAQIVTPLLRRLQPASGTPAAHADR
jgi:hypothetical protein